MSTRADWPAAENVRLNLSQTCQNRFCTVSYVCQYYNTYSLVKEMQRIVLYSRQTPVNLSRIDLRTIPLHWLLYRFPLAGDPLAVRSFAPVTSRSPQPPSPPHNALPASPILCTYSHPLPSPQRPLSASSSSFPIFLISHWSRGTMYSLQL